jgi:hypothetical protein
MTFDFTAMIPQVNLFSFVFWEKLKTQKRHFEINWPLGTLMKTEDNLKLVTYDVLFWFIDVFVIRKIYISVDIVSVYKKMQEDHQSIIVFIATDSQQSTVKVGSVGHP